jgi:hypothetical protein
MVSRRADDAGAQLWWAGSTGAAAAAERRSWRCHLAEGGAKYQLSRGKAADSFASCGMVRRLRLFPLMPVRAHSCGLPTV